MKKPLIDITDWSGGMTLKERAGGKNQFHIGNQIDFSSQPGKLTVGSSWYNMGLASGDIDFQVPFFQYTSDNELYIGGDNAKIYKKTDTGTFTLQHTDTNGSGVKGMTEYKGYLIWASNGKLGRFDLSSTWNDNWQSLNNSTTDFHYLKVWVDNILYIADGRYLDTWDGTTFTSQALDLDVGWEIRCLETFGNLYLAIGASFSNTYSKIFLWNGTDSSWNDEILIPEPNIKAMKFKNGYLWVWAGNSANLYVVPVGSRTATKIWQFTKENPKNNLTVYPGAVVERGGTIFFALSGVDSNSYKINPAGIYSFRADPSRFTVNLVFQDTGYTETYKGMGVGVSGSGGIVIYCSEYNSTSSYYRIKREKVESNEAPYSSEGYMETFWYDAPSNTEMITEVFGIECDALPSSTYIKLYYKKQGDSSWTQIGSTFQTAGETKFLTKKIIHNIISLKLKVSIKGSTSSNSYLRPFVTRLFVTGGLVNRKY